MLPRPLKLLLLLLFCSLFFWTGAAHATIYPGYTGTTANDGTKLNGLVGAPFTAGCGVQTYNGNLYCSLPIFTLSSKGLPLEIHLSYNSQLRLPDTPYGRGGSSPTGSTTLSIPMGTSPS